MIASAPRATVPGRLRCAELSIEGWSRAGEETWFRLHPPGLALDAGRGAAAQVGAGDLFLTHGHLDHCAGLPWWLSQRRFQGLGPSRIFCPAPIVADVDAFVAAAERLERVEFEREIVGLEPGSRVRVGRDLEVEAFAVDHVVPALGYHLLRKRRRLRPDLVGAPGPSIAALRRAGEPVELEEEEVWLSYCGDTGEGVFSSAPRLVESRVVLLECTFVGADGAPRAADYGHLHLEQIAAAQGAFDRCEALVLHHLSRRHAVRELASEVRRCFSASLAERTHLFVPEGT